MYSSLYILHAYTVLYVAGLTGPVRGLGGPSPQAMAPTGGSVASKLLTHSSSICIAS